MPPSKPKPSEIAAEAKRSYIPYIVQKFPELPPRSFLHADSDQIRVAQANRIPSKKLRVAVIDGDLVDVALDWQEYECKTKMKLGQKVKPVPLVNMANEKRAGGDWESGLLAPEETLCRRSNLVHCLTTPSTVSGGASNYPIPTKGGVYSPHVVVFRSGPEKAYTVWPNFKNLPVISVAPIRRPKLDSSGKNYSFAQEKELMKEKIRIVLRIAAAWNHRDVCVGAFGAGPGFRNPIRQLATMWRNVMFSEAEFQNAFDNIVFAIENTREHDNTSQPTDYEVFKQEFDPANVFKTAYR